MLVSRWAVFLAVLSALGLFVLRALIARPVVRGVRGTLLRPLNVAFGVAAAPRWSRSPSTSCSRPPQFTLRSVADLGALVPLLATRRFGRGFLDLELRLALFAVAAASRCSSTGPSASTAPSPSCSRRRRALAAAAAMLLVPGAAGHAGQKSPRGLALALDGAHLGSGSVWLGGLIGLLVLWLSLGRQAARAVLAYVVPRFSASPRLGAAADRHRDRAPLLELPTLASLWQTSTARRCSEDRLLAAALALAAVQPAAHEARLRR